MSEFKIIGKLGGINKRNKYYMVDIAENKYNSEGEKINTIWYNCICAYKPRAKIGQLVIATGSFVSSRNENFPYALEINHIGVINEGGDNG